MDAENGAWTEDRVHEFSPPTYLCWTQQSWDAKQAPNQASNMIHCKNGEKGWFWKKHYDLGFGINSGYHKLLTDDDRFLDWKWQLEQAWILYQKGTPFYGKNNIGRTKQNFIIIN